MDEDNSPSPAPAERPSSEMDELLGPLSVVVNRLLAAAEVDPSLRSALRRLAEQVLERTAEVEAEATAEPDADPDSASAGAPAVGGAPDSSEILSPPTEYERRFFAAAEPRGVAEPAPVAEVSESKADVDAGADAAPEPSPVTDAELPLIEQRCRLKAEAARWAATRRRRLREGAERSEMEREDQQLISRARALPDCFLWMSRPDAPEPMDASGWVEIADCFDGLAEAVELVRMMIADAERDQDLFRPGLPLLAEAQSMLRAAVLRIGGREDHDQRKVHHWLQRVTAERSIYIERYMKADDAADPATLADLLRRVRELRDRWLQREGRRRRRHEGFQRIRYHLTQLADNPLKPEHDRGVIVRTVDDLVEAGTPPSDTELRQILLPRLDDLAELEQVPPGMRRVLDEIDRYLATRPAADPDTAAIEPTAEVTKVRRLLEGRVAVMIGGKRRPESQRNLEQAFGLRELRWEDCSPHQPLDDFEPAITRPEVAVVLLAIRWSSHSFGQLKQVCDRVGKPLVRLPAGYGVNRVAAEILAQCSAQLESDLTA